MERKFIFTKQELEEFVAQLWMDGFYAAKSCHKDTGPMDEYRTMYKDIEDRIKHLYEE